MPLVFRLFAQPVTLALRRVLSVKLMVAVLAHLATIVLLELSSSSFTHALLVLTAKMVFTLSVLQEQLVTHFTVFLLMTARLAHQVNLAVLVPRLQQHVAWLITARQVLPLQVYLAQLALSAVTNLVRQIQVSA